MNNNVKSLLRSSDCTACEKPERLVQDCLTDNLSRDEVLDAFSTGKVVQYKQLNQPWKDFGNHAGAPNLSEWFEKGIVPVNVKFRICRA